MKVPSKHAIYYEDSPRQVVRQRVRCALGWDTIILERDQIQWIPNFKF